jgi:hypothetical protein
MTNILPGLLRYSFAGRQSDPKYSKYLHEKGD